jgi:hypothetical protein
LKVGQIDINGNVYGKTVVGKHLIMVMENYIGSQGGSPRNRIGCNT